MILVSSTILLASLSMFAFPRRLPRKKSKVASPVRQQRNCNGNKAEHPKSGGQVVVAQNKNPSLKDFPKAIRRLLKNEILLLRTASSVLHILPIAGLYTFLPKYLESQFRMAAHVANMIIGCLPTILLELKLMPYNFLLFSFLGFNRNIWNIGHGIWNLL